MQLTEALDRALDARYALGAKSPGREPRTPISDGRGLRARMHRIMDRFGGRAEPSARREAARAAGIPYSTWNHALNGRNVSKKTLGRIGEAFGKIVTAPARARRVAKVGVPTTWAITAVVVASPGDEDEGPEDNSGGGSRYVNGHGSGVSREDAAALDTDDPGYRTFNAAGLDGERIVDAWLSHGAEAAAGALLDEITDVYGTEFGFEGDNVEVDLS